MAGARPKKRFLIENLLLGLCVAFFPEGFIRAGLFSRRHKRPVRAWSDLFELIDAYFLICPSVEKLFHKTKRSMASRNCHILFVRFRWM